MQTLCSLSHHLHFFSYPKTFQQFLWFFLTINRPAGNTPASKSPVLLRGSPLTATPPATKYRRTQRGGAASSSPSAPLQVGYFFSASAPFLQPLLFQKLRAVGSSDPRAPTGWRATEEGLREGGPRAGSAQLCWARRGDLARWVEEGALAGRRPCPGARKGARAMGWRLCSPLGARPL